MFSNVLVKFTDLEVVMALVEAQIGGQLLCGGWRVVEVTVAVLGSSNTWQASSWW